MSRTLVVDLRARAPIWSLPDSAVERLRAATPSGWDAHIVNAPTVSDGDGGTAPSAEVRDAIANAEAYFGFGISHALWLDAHALRWVHSAAAGVGSVLFPEMRESPVILTNSAGVHAVPIAEHVVGGVLFLMRGFDIAQASQHARRWNREAFTAADSPMREMGECRVLIIGAGGLGSAIARRLAVLGASCTGVRRHPERGLPTGFSRVVGDGEWESLLGETDILVLAAPATKETHGMVGGAQLDRLPAHAIVVNVARGSLLDEAALAQRVASGRLRGAQLDVFAEEPLPSDSPLWDLPSVLITPHVSGVSRGFWERELDLFLDNWRRYIAGEPMRNVVDKAAGY